MPVTLSLYIINSPFSSSTVNILSEDILFVAASKVILPIFNSAEAGSFKFITSLKKAGRKLSLDSTEK